MDTLQTLKIRLLKGGLAFGFVLIVGSLGFWFIGQGDWLWWDCFYFTVITLSTVGFGETLPHFDKYPHARLWTVVLIVAGSGTLVYFISTLSALIIESDLRANWRKRRMKKAIDELRNHVIVCGAGRTGIHVVEELTKSRAPFVLVERDEAKAQHLAEHLGKEGLELLYVTGDATEDEVLKSAGIERARAVVAALSEDKDNLFVTVAASALNPDVRIVAKCMDVSARPKLIRAGAKAVVSPTQIGGLRLASEAIRPTVVEFLDTMLRRSDAPMRIEEIHVPKGHPLVGQEIRRAGLRRYANALILAMRTPEGAYIHNPEPHTRIEAGAVLIVFSTVEGIERLRRDLVEAGNQRDG
ncbi:MAG: potassium channel protein [Sandaracinaceae bacterium]|nr:potassium channel protein [Sandaracinaceae bacterium]